MSTAVQTPIADSSPAVTPETMNKEQRAVWLKTGKLPEIEPTKAESAPAKTDEKAVTAPAEGGTAPASEAGKSQQPPRKTAAERKAELGSEIQALLERRGVLKSEDFWKEFDEFRKTKGEKRADAPAAKEPAVSEVREPKEPERPKRPKRADFTTEEAYETAMEKHDEALMEYPAKKAAYDTAKAQAEEAKAKIETWNKQVEQSWKERVEAAQGKHEDFNEKAFAKDLPIVQGSPVDEWILLADSGAEMLYHLATHRDELTKLNEMKRPAQHKALAKLDEELGGSGEITPKEEEAEKAPPPKPETKKVTAAGKPPVEVGGKGTVEADPIKTAVAKGDFKSYRTLMNDKDIARRKQGK